MLWDELNVLEFSKAVKETGGVCVLPIGVLEKHGNHLPLGTDMITAASVCKAAAEKESAIVFPYYFMGQISEARQYPGTVSLSLTMLMENLLAVCDEISRNGLKKILIMSGHGGNYHFLPFFAQEFPRHGRDYQVYTAYASALNYEQSNKIRELAGADDLGSHAGLSETSVLMHLRGDLVKKELSNPEDGASKRRIAEVRQKGLFTGFNWYAEYPNHFAGDHSLATAKLGEVIFDMLVENAASAIKVVKNDTESFDLMNEYFERSKTPGV